MNINYIVTLIVLCMLTCMLVCWALLRTVVNTCYTLLLAPGPSDANSML